MFVNIHVHQYMNRRKIKTKVEPAQLLKGWKAVGDYLGIGQGAAQRWAKSGMPVRREGRFTVADVDEIRRWLAREAHMPAPAYVATGTSDVTAALKQSIAAARKKNRH